MNETLEAMARAIFKDWFVDFGPVRAKMEGREPYLSPEIWDLFPARLDDEGKPEGWYTSVVGDEFTLTMGQAPPGDSYNANHIGVPFFQGRTDFGPRYPTIRMFCTQPTRLAYRDDTLVSVRAPVGEINMAPEKCCIGRGVAAVRHRLGGRSYTYQAVKQIQEQIRVFEDTGTVFGSINKKQFRSLSAMRPSDNLVSEFEKLCEPFDERIRQNVFENQKLRQMRDILLPRLISGEAEIRDAEIGSGDAA